MAPPRTPPRPRKPCGGRGPRGGAASFWAACLLLAGCPKPPPAPPPPPPAAARVDGVDIPLATVQRELDRVRRAGGEAGADAGPAETKEPPARLGRALLEPLIDRQLVSARARAERLLVSDADVQRAMDNLADAARRAGQPFAERLAQDGLTREQLLEELRERLLAERWLSGAVKVERPTPAEVKAAYDKAKSEFDQPEQVRCAQILVASAAEAKALLDQSRKGTPFDELARQHSQSPDARAGGDLGFFAKGTMPPPFDEACFSLKHGQVSGVLRSRYGFHLFKALERRAARRKTLQEAAPELERRLFDQRRLAAERALLEGLREKAKIVVDEAALATLR